VVDDPEAHALNLTRRSSSRQAPPGRSGRREDGPQKRFRITAHGEEALAAWLHTPPDLISPPRDELVMKVLVAARVPGTDAHEVIQAHRMYLVELMQQWTRLKEDEARDDLGLALVVDAELFRLDAVTRWLDAAGTRIKRAAGRGEHLGHRGVADEPELAAQRGSRPGVRDSCVPWCQGAAWYAARRSQRGRSGLRGRSGALSSPASSP
jgi:DNA-binding PadR family transcriptional regulator